MGLSANLALSLLVMAQVSPFDVLQTQETAPYNIPSIPSTPNTSSVPSGIKPPASPVIANDIVDDESEAIQPIAPPKNYTALKLRGLDKVTARASEFEASIGTVTRFRNLEVIPRACWESPDEEVQKEQAGLMEVWHWKQGEKPSLVFFGWMFAGSPSISSLAHPVYDITMVSCVEKTDEKEEPSAKAEEIKEN